MNEMSSKKMRARTKIIWGLLVVLGAWNSTGCETTGERVEKGRISDHFNWFQENKINASQWEEQVFPTGLHCYNIQLEKENVVYCDKRNMNIFNPNEKKL